MFYLLAIGFGMRAVALVLMLVLVGGGESALGPLKPAAVAAAAVVVAALASVVAALASVVTALASPLDFLARLVSFAVKCLVPAFCCCSRASSWLPRSED
jgi:hypothetical protein